jgi:Holliday junction resolvase RusA-like endonuclease
MKKVELKALSSNDMYLGRKVKSYQYKTYERKMLKLLPDQEVPEGELQLTFEVGLSSKLADLDNTLKPFIDCLQLKYGFNDKWIYSLVASKTIVAKGEEFITFKLEEYNGEDEGQPTK